MKRLAYFLGAALIVAGSASCDKDPVDFPIVGTFTFTGTYNTYSHGTQGWTADDQLGIFVTSDGVAQSNLLYTPAEYSKLEESEYVPGYFVYGDPVATTTFKAASEQTGLKQGEHMVYAYVPYGADNKDFTAIKLQDNGSQEYNSTSFSPDQKYNFAYAKLASPVTEYTAEAISFGDFVTPFTQITVPSPKFADKELLKGGESIDKVVITSTVDIAIADGTINLETGEITGTKSKSIEISFANEKATVEYSAWLGASLPTFYIIAATDFATANDAEYTISVTIDGKEYTATGKPFTQWGITEGNVNLYNAFTIE